MCIFEQLIIKRYTNLWVYFTKPTQLASKLRKITYEIISRPEPAVCCPNNVLVPAGNVEPWPSPPIPVDVPKPLPVPTHRQ